MWIIVEDHGHGHDAEVLARVDEPFFTTKAPGQGLGLGVFLARLDHRAARGIPAHRLECRRRHDGDAAAAGGITGQGATMEAESARTLLLVEDDETFRTRLARAFRDRGLVVTEAGTAEAAIAAARTDSPELAVVDLRLPRASGLDVVRELWRSIPTTAVVVLTGYGSIATALEAVRLGARHYLTKPADADQILAAFEGDAAPAGAASLRRRAVARARGVGAHPARAARLRRQHLAGRAPARPASPVAAAQAAQVPVATLNGPRGPDAMKERCGAYMRTSAVLSLSRHG